MEETKKRGAWGLIVDSWKLSRKNYGSFIWPIAITLVLQFVFALLFGLLFVSIVGLGLGGGNLSNLIVLIIPILILLVFQIWISIAITQVANFTSLVQGFKISEVFKNSTKRIVTLFLLGLLFSLIVLIVILIPLLFFWLGAAAKIAMTALTTLIVAVLVIYLSVIVTIATISVSIDVPKPSVIGSFKLALAMVKKRWWSTLWRLIAPQIFYGVILMIILFGLLGIITGGQVNLLSWSGNLYSNILTTVISALFIPLLTYPMVLLYQDLKK